MPIKRYDLYCTSKTEKKNGVGHLFSTLAKSLTQPVSQIVPQHNFVNVLFAGWYLRIYLLTQHTAQSVGHTVCQQIAL